MPLPTAYLMQSLTEPLCPYVLTNEKPRLSAWPRRGSATPQGWFQLSPQQALCAHSAPDYRYSRCSAAVVSAKRKASARPFAGMTARDSPRLPITTSAGSDRAPYLLWR